MGKIMAVNISEKKGTQKKNVHSARLMEEFGIDETQKRQVLRLKIRQRGMEPVLRLESRRTPMPASGIAR